MKKSKWKEFFEEIVFEKTAQSYYIPIMDSDGHELTEDEILFMNEKGYQGKQNLEVWGNSPENVKQYTVNSPEVELICEEGGTFPTALKSPEGEVMYLKVAATTGEILPIHAGCCPVYDAIYVGAPGAGKTTNILQMSDPAFHDMIAKNTTCCIEDDLPTTSSARKRYEEAANRLKAHILPETTRRGENILPYVYHVTYKEDGRNRHMLLRLQDIDGEQCCKITWKSKLFSYNTLLLMIGADELIAGERGETVQYNKMIDGLLPRLKVLKHEEGYDVVVIISKCDLLDFENPLLEKAIRNSVEIVNDRMEQRIHHLGFDFSAYQDRGNAVQEYLKNECPNFYNKLMNTIPERNISFCMLASIGAACEGNRFEHYRPFCIDEPVLSILAKHGMYPITDYGERPKAKKVRGFMPRENELYRRCRDWFWKLKEAVFNDDRFEEYEGVENEEEEEW